MDTPGRLLRLLVLLSGRASWSAAELVERLEVTDRTVRRDVTRLRDLGYPVTATTGRYGGYALGAGGRLPPLLLDDDEAVAVWVALQEMAAGARPVLGEAAVAAMTKLGQVLPTALRERVDTLGEVTVGLRRSGRTGGDQPASVATLMALAQACRREDRVRFDYRAGDDRTSRRHVEPHRLVTVRDRWYLVAFDLDRDDWRTFRVDRISGPAPTGARATPRPAPDAAAFVAEGLAVRVFDVQATIRLPLTPDDARRGIPPTVGVVDPGPPDAEHAIVRIGGDPDWIARYLVGLPCSFEVLEPHEVRREVRRLAHRLLREHPATTSPAEGHR
ncbi:MAG: YafY family transcriptional regulator [Acidimicrobiia bacterium]|nr:YafY family transcriptional regulator [Acidimicrobiia bacterium]